jgi:hypothetical protein
MFGFRTLAFFNEMSRTAPYYYLQRMRIVDFHEIENYILKGKKYLLGDDLTIYEQINQRMTYGNFK